VKPDVGWDRMSSVDDDDEEDADAEDGGPALAEEDDVQGQVPLPDEEDGTSDSDEGAERGDAGRGPGE